MRTSYPKLSGDLTTPGSVFAIAPDATDPADLGVLEAAELLRSGRLSAPS